DGRSVPRNDRDAVPRALTRHHTAAREPMRIAHVLSSFAMGGQERVALDLAAAQARRGHHVSAVSIAPLPHGALAVRFEEAGVRVLSAPKARGFDGTLALRLARLFRHERVDVVHTHNPQPLAYGAPAG